MLKERTYAALIEAAHGMAKDKGWWEGGVAARSLDDQFNNFHAEISEAWEEYRAGRMTTWYSHHGVAVKDHDFAIVDGMPMANMAALHKTEPEWTPAKPEGFWIEIADLLIRLADTCGAYELAPGENYCSEGTSDISKLIARLHAGVVAIENEIARGGRANREIGCMFAFCFICAAGNGIDLWQAIELKMAYNATRSHRHGNKLA